MLDGVSGGAKLKKIAIIEEVVLRQEDKQEVSGEGRSRAPKIVAVVMSAALLSACGGGGESNPDNDDGADNGSGNSNGGGTSAGLTLPASGDMYYDIIDGSVNSRYKWTEEGGEILLGRDFQNKGHIRSGKVLESVAGTTRVQMEAVTNYPEFEERFPLVLNIEAGADEGTPATEHWEKNKELALYINMLASAAANRIREDIDDQRGSMTYSVGPDGCQIVTGLSSDTRMYITEALICAGYTKFSGGSLNGDTFEITTDITGRFGTFNGLDIPSIYLTEEAVANPEGDITKLIVGAPEGDEPYISDLFYLEGEDTKLFNVPGVVSAPDAVRSIQSWQNNADIPNEVYDGLTLEQQSCYNEGLITDDGVIAYRGYSNEHEGTFVPGESGVVGQIRAPKLEEMCQD